MIGIGISITQSNKTAFTPLAVSGCVCWLDASDASTITESGGVVIGWADKSGFGNSAVQTTFEQRPLYNTRTINGLNALEFNGVDDRMLLPSGLYNITNGNNTVFMVASFDNIASGHIRLFNGFESTTSGRWFIARDMNLNRLTVRSGLNDAAITTLADDTLQHTMALRRNGTVGGLTGYYDGAPTITNDGNDFVIDNLVLGGSASVGSYLDGTMCEVIIYNRALTFSEMNLVGNALNKKWATPWTNI